MWLLAFAVFLQIAVILELVLNRIIGVLYNARRTPMRKLADGSFCGSLLALVMSVLTIPVSLASAAAQLFVSYLTFWLSLLLVIAVLAVLSETSSALIVLYVNAYNSGIGQTLNEMLVSLFEFVAPFWRAVVPLYNALAYVVVGFWVDVLLPIVFLNAKLLPDLIINFTVLVGSTAASTSEWFSRISKCTDGAAHSDSASSPFWVNDLSCVGNPHFMTLDLMTPALYAQRTATTLQEILTTSCVPVTNAIALVIYPLLDINLYKAVHGLMNSLLHALVSLPVITQNRCAYAHGTTDYAYTAVEMQVMCTPDVSALTSILVAALKSAGALVDNWLDTVLVVAENSITGVVRSCAPTPLPLVWQNASDILGTSEIQVVGLTPSMYAITDADSVVYHSMVGASLRVAYALHAWPFKVDLRFGVAAVSYNAVPDVDDEGDGRTGMLGCRCVDTDAGLQLMCASVPFQKHLSEDADEQLEYTVHRIRFVPDSARFDLRCRQVTVRVVPLRFSRRRFSAPGAGRVELGFEDEFNTRLHYGTSATVDHTVDAAIILTPMCAVHASVLCVPSIENCFPFCMGLHAAGQRSQNISLMNAQRWDEWTSLGQTDCVVANAVAGACAADGAQEHSRLLQNDEVGVEITGCAATACVPDTASVTFIKNSEQAVSNRSMSAWLLQQEWGFVRSALQPFVSAGDVFLYQSASASDDVSGQILVTRLYDNKRGDFSLQQEKLSLLTNSFPMQYYQCSDETCYTTQLRENHVVLPDDYFVRDNPTIAAASEWAVHWTATPSSGKCALIYDFCAQTSGHALVTMEAHRPRLWTLRTMRHTDALGKPFTEEALASYMLIPDWFSCSHADFRHESQCQAMYNMKVTGLEYMNADNLLLTVLAARPSDWDWKTELVRDGRPFEYRFYFVHPNRHDCAQGNDTETMYTCWRSAEEGMFSAPSSISETGALCPMLQRMPKWGSMVTEVLVSQVFLLKVLLDALFIMPLVFRGGVDDLFGQHPHPTFHSVLDASGNTLFEMEDVLQAMQLSAFHAANTIARAGALMQSLGVQELETVLVGTARIFELTKAASTVEDTVFGKGAESVSAPYNRLVSQFGSQTTQAAPMATPGTPVSLSTQASSRFVGVFQSIAGPSVSWSRITVKLMRKVLIKVIRQGQVRALAVRDMAATLITSVYESEQEISHGLFDNMKTICDASGQIVGRTNSWGQSVRHSCMLVPESMQAVIQVILILTVDYQVMDCVCKQTESFTLEHVLADVCLPRILPMARKAFVMQSIAQKSTSACFAVMDSVNEKLLRAFEPVFSRMVKAQAAIESAFGLLVTQAMGVDSLNMKCMQYDSPFVVSIMPEPVDYFMGCMQTFDCRARCLDTMKAFDESLLAYGSHSAEPLAYTKTSDIDTESRYFSYHDMELGKHLAPFSVYAVLQLPASACVQVCPTQQSRCVAVAGLRLGALAVAYYCVPASLVMSVYEGIAPPASSGAYNDAMHASRTVIDVQFATVHKREVGSFEWLVLLARDHVSYETSVWVLPSGVQDAAWQIVETQVYNGRTAVSTDNTQDPLWPAETIAFVRVLPANAYRATATIFVVGSMRLDDGDTDAAFCWYVLVDTSFEGSAVDLTRHACVNAPTTVYSKTHATVCLDYDCAQVVRIPITGDSEVRLETLTAYATVSGAFDWTVTSSRSFTMPDGQRAVLDVDSAAVLSTSRDLTLQVTRRMLSPFGSVTRGQFHDAKLSIDVPLTGRGQVSDTWLQNVRLKLEAGSMELKVGASFTTAQRLEMVVNCTVTTCVGCHGRGPLEVDLQNKCFAAASCGIAKCVGTPVNMKRPMCQIASLLGLQIAFVRVSMQSFWDFFSRSIITIVELTQSRRKLYEISTPQEKTMATICGAKDGIIQSFAMFGALYVQIPAETLDSASREPLSLQEIRYNTQRVMVATAVVELLSQIGLGAVYVPLVSSKVMQCQLNDAFLVIEGIATMIAEGTTHAEIVKFRMGSQKFDNINEYAVGMCLTDKFKQDMRDIADPAREQSMLSGMQDILDGVIGLVTTEKYGITAMSLDALFAWVLGMLSGTINLLQVIDSANCRLPAIDALVVGSCVCSDKPARIPERQRSSKQIDALWCRGPLMMTSVLGNDVLVWNPYSLTELLAHNKVQEYFECLETWSGNVQVCIGSRPVNALFESQGVDVLQVIIRCRSNYQQKRWDEGALALGLLEHAEDWRAPTVSQASLAQMYSQAGSSFQTLRKRLAQISLSISEGFADLDEDTWSCLRVALFANQWNHNCAELALANGIFAHADSLLTYFEYDTYEVHGVLRADASRYENIDACESFSGGLQSRNSNGASYPRMAWDGDSQNTVPVAEMHNKLQADDELRLQQAEAELAILIRTQIEPAFAKFTEERMDAIQTEFWSLEGDSIHQVVDCVMLGPYAAADMLPRHRKLETFETPQYHRGSAQSREIFYGLQTQGSPARKKIMAEVIGLISTNSDAHIRERVLAVVRSVQQAYSVRQNLYCTCLGKAAPSVECCVSNAPMHTDLAQFASTFSAQSVLPALQDMLANFTAVVVDEATQAKILEEIWYDEAAAIDVLFSEAERQALASLYAFAYDEPVREYSVHEVPHHINLTLWAYCVQSLEAVFFTMPLRVDFDGRATVDAETNFDPGTTTESDANRYLHGMERAIEDILEKSKLHSPTYWSHVHRYMPSDSVWCEDTTMREVPRARNATYPQQWNDLDFSSDRVAAPGADEVLYVARLGSTCVCGLGLPDGSCSVPAELCTHVPENTSRWTDLCSTRTYSTSGDAFLVRLALYRHSELLAHCDESQASTAWGLLDSEQRMHWYNSSSDEQKVSLHEVAAQGPAGVRLAMLLRMNDAYASTWALPRAPPVNIDDAVNARFDHTVAQPVCRASQHTLFTEHLGDYFRDVLFPMAHAVHEAPSQVICARWVVEYALYVAILNMTGPSSSATQEQRFIEERWRDRCTFQLETVGLCNLRNVYSLVPPGRQNATHCKFTIPEHECLRFYVTDSCLLMCDGQLFDPCLCANADACAVVFAKNTCVGGRRYKPLQSDMDLDSMHWPVTVWPLEQAQQHTLDRFRTASALTHPLALQEGLFDLLRKQAAAEDGAVPVAFCDELVDYMDPDAQHPVGYHPTCACDRDETNMRGFDSWMSTAVNSEHGYSVDPVRMRNMSMYSTTFGAAHLTCDAAAYGSSGAQLNALRMQSKWNSNARADPAMPVQPDMSSEASMTDFGVPSADQHDTPLQAPAASQAMLRHSVGLVRDWLRNYENETEQLALDALWPHWLDTDAARAETFSAPSAHELHPECRLPALLRCYEDNDCTARDHTMRCKKNAFGGVEGDAFGICVRLDTCYQHTHCGDGKLCSGTGFCEQPEIIVDNALPQQVNVRVFAKNSKRCTGSAFGTSAFQRVPTFARDNGLCSVHNLFNYRNLTLDVRAALGRESIRSVEAHSTRFIPDAFSWLSIADASATDARNALKMEAHPCDRAYEHSDYATCLPEDLPLDPNADVVPTFACTRTWREEDTKTKVDFCHLQVGQGVFDTLTSPYMNYDDKGESTDTLTSTKTTIQQCIKFSFCPSPVFTVGGLNVDRFIWQTASREDVTKYPLSYAAQCMSFGLWDGVHCRVDAFIVPLMRVVFRDAAHVSALEAPFNALRDECSDAFGARHEDALYRFQATYSLLSEPYSPSNDLVTFNAASCEGMQDKSIHCVAHTINKLIEVIFDLPHKNRGLGDLQEYASRARCATHIYRRLQEVKLENAELLRPFNILPESVPGSAFYMFSGHFPVEVPLSWFWKCVLIATETQGGARADWFATITSPAATDRLECKNVMSEVAPDATLRAHLQMQSDIYSSNAGSAADEDVFDEIMKIMKNVVDTWDVTSIPTLICKEKNKEQSTDCDTVNQYDKKDKKCWKRVANTRANTLAYHVTALTACEADDTKCTLYDVMFHFLFGLSSKKIRQEIVLTVDWMVQNEIAVRLDLDTQISQTFSYADMIPEIEFSRMHDLNHSLIHNARASEYTIDHREQNPLCERPLDHTEYELAKRIVELTDTGAAEGEFRFYHHILGFPEMAQAQEEQNEEAYQYYTITDKDKDSTTHVAISQKQMLLLALYYLRQTMYFGVSQRFGTMRYAPDIRNFMLRDRAMAQDLSVRLDRAKLYDRVVKLQNFLCPENKEMSTAVPSDVQRQLIDCLKDLKVNVGWAVAAGKKLVVQADADMLLNAFYVTFAGHEAGSFLDELINTEWHKEPVAHDARLCFSTPDGAAPLIPLWSGMLDLQSCPHGESCGCQLSASELYSIVDLTCDRSTNIDSCKADFPSFDEHVKRAMYDKCWQMQGNVVSVAQYEQMRGGSLCSRKPAPVASCALPFGAQGRVSGITTADLHSSTPVERVQAGLFAETNTLFHGKAAPDVDKPTALRMLATDIGGHSIRFLARYIGRARSRTAVLDLTCVSAGRRCVHVAFSNWLSTIASSWAVQHNAHTSRNNLEQYATPAAGGVHWQCPLQWLGAYADRTVVYAARSPSADRNRIRFRHLTGTKVYAHATVVDSTRVAQHPARFLSDDSACVDAVVVDGVVQFRCQGRALLLNALGMHRGRWTPARFVSGATPDCGSLLDWPHRYWQTVDENVSATPDASFYCNVFWRLPSFALRYVPRAAAELPDKLQNARPAGTACHMGRLRKFTLTETDSTQFCTAESTQARCRMLRRNNTWYEHDFKFEAPFAAKRRPATRERQCSKCDRHDTASFIDRRTRETPLAHKVPQLSVGEPTTVSTERLLAAALRRHACPHGPSAPCPNQYDLFNASTWRRGRLLEELLALATKHQQKYAPRVSDDELWAAPWVLCDQVQNETRCRGSISKKEWQNASTRAAACLRETNAAVSRERSSMDFCMLSEETAALCRKVSDWNSEITHILCTAGKHAKCTSRAFYYNPSQYSISNKDFVYNSVSGLYTKLNRSACPAEAQHQSESNQHYVDACMSSALEPVVLIVKLMRLVLRKLVMAVYYFGQVCFAILGLIMSHLSDASGATAEYFADSLHRFVHLLLTVITQAQQQIWQITWALLDFGDFKFMKTILMWLCQFIQYVLAPIIETFVLTTITAMIGALKLIDGAICTLSLNKVCNSIPIAAFEDTRELLRGIKPQCTMSNPRNVSRPADTLLAATRCWSTYNTYYGDSGRLSCTAADTCRAGITDFSLVVCGTCVSFEDYLPFGCYDVTKTCTCNLPLLAEQGCTSNTECAAIDATCRFIDSDLEPSVGFTQCASCQTKRVCLLTSGRADGFCACGLVDIELQRCVAQTQPAMPSYDKLCVYTQDYRFLTTTNYVFSFYTSMTAPCNQLNPSSTFCARETSDGQLYVVGVDSVRRRHLLGAASSESAMAATDTHNSLCKDALSSDVMPAHRTACRAAYEYSGETLRLLDLPWPLPTCTFCSVEDAVHGLLLQPHNLVMLATNVSRVMQVIMRHSPLRVLSESARRVTKTVSTAMQIAAAEPALRVEHTNDTWHVHTLVDNPSVDMLARVLKVVLARVPPPANTSRLPSGRRLLTVDDIAEAMQQNFRVSAALRQAFATQLASSLDYVFESPASQKEWMKTWPPHIGSAVLPGNLCPPLTNMLSTTRRALGTIDKAYSMQDEKVPADSVEHAWIKVSRRNEVNVSWTDYAAVRALHDPVTAAVLFAVDWVMARVGLSPNYIFDVLAAAAEELWYFVKCDYEAVQTCSKWRVHVLIASIVVAVYYVGVYIVCAAVGLSMPVVLAAVVLPSVVLYLSYGYSPLCFPTVPVCLYDDLVYSIQQLVPPNIRLPTVLYRSETCMSAAATRLDTACLRTCTDEPFSFLEWYDVLSWCALELRLESALVQFIRQPVVSLVISQQMQDDIQAAVDFHARVFRTPDTDLITTNRLCALISSYKLIPQLALLFVCVMLALGLVQTLMLTVNVAFQVTFALFVSAFY